MMPVLCEHGFQGVLIPFYRHPDQVFVPSTPVAILNEFHGIFSWGAYSITREYAGRVSVRFSDKHVTFPVGIQSTHIAHLALDSRLSLTLAFRI